MVDKIIVIGCNDTRSISAEGMHDFVWYLMSRGLSLNYIIEILNHVYLEEDGIRQRRDAKIRKAKRWYNDFRESKIRAPGWFKNIKYLTECNYKALKKKMGVI